MKVNLHTHTPRCHHAEGSEREYIEKAIEGGMTVLGFADHAPMIFDGDYYSTFRMRPEELEDYVTTILDLKKEYEKDIHIYLGLEAEYYPRHFESFLKMLEPYPMDYLLQGQHFVGNEDDAKSFYSGALMDEDAKLHAYVNQVIEGMQTGHFLYLAHPDLIYYEGEETFYKKEMARLVDYSIALDVPLEINLQGIWLERHYPSPWFWEIAGAKHARAVIGADAHFPDKLYIPEVYTKAVALAEKCGVVLVQDTLEDRMLNR